MIQALAKIGDERAVRPLLNLLEVARREAGIGVKGSYLGGTAIRALATLGEGSVVRLVLEEWEEEMESTLRLLGAAAQPQLEERLQHDRSPHIRALAAEGLGIVGSQSALGSLITALNDQDERVRDACAWSLQQIYDV